MSATKFYIKKETIEKLWREFKVIGVDDECHLKADFQTGQYGYWEQGTPEEEVLDWFGTNYEGGIDALDMLPEGEGSPIVDVDDLPFPEPTYIGAVDPIGGVDLSKIGEDTIVDPKAEIHSTIVTLKQDMEDQEKEPVTTPGLVIKTDPDPIVKEKKTRGPNKVNSTSGNKKMSIEDMKKSLEEKLKLVGIIEYIETPDIDTEGLSKSSRELVVAMLKEFDQLKEKYILQIQEL